jgi:hypothetical protein
MAQRNAFGAGAPCLALLAVLAACASAGPQIQALAYVDESRAAGLHTFNVVPVGMCEGSSLLEQQFLDIVARSFEARGLRRTAESPQAMMFAACDAQTQDQRRPGTTLFLPVTNLVTGDTMGVMSTTTPGRVVTQYARSLVIQIYAASDLRAFLDLRDAGESPSPPVPVWDGRARLTSGNADLLEVAGAMVESMLRKAALGTAPPTIRR